MEDGKESEQISDAFTCAVCLDLLYKPIVLACGHVSCFWCVHRSMSSRRESHCPLCRHPYHYFPAICQMLHFLLLKVYPVAYKRREKQVLEDEKKLLCFSPNLDSLVTNEEPNPLGDPDQSSTMSSQNYLSVDPSSGIGEACAIPKQLEFSHFHDNDRANPKENSTGGFETFSPVADEEKKLHHRISIRTCKQVSLADLLCVACKQLLFQPVVLYCGHVYCEACVTIPADGTIKCQVCQFPHPGEFPKVCLELDHFLEEEFSSEYALRRGTAQLKEVHSRYGSPTTSSTEAAVPGLKFSFPTDENFLQFLADRGSKFHAGVGCDSCGMCPIIGDRYRCKDCTERMGFDLCGECYNSCSKLAGRFNQQHTAEHTFEKVQRIMRLFSGISGQLSLVSAATNQSSVAMEVSAAIESPENGFPSNDDENDLASLVTPTDTLDDQSDDQSHM